MVAYGEVLSLHLPLQVQISDWTTDCVRGVCSSKELRLGSGYKLRCMLHAKTSIPLSGPTFSVILSFRQTSDLTLRSSEYPV